MPGPVFVLDAQGTPLMPMGAAHARVLLTRGSAERISHPAFSILRLAHTIPAPKLYPIVIGISMSPSIAELFVVATGLRTIRPLLYIVADSRPTTNSALLEYSGSRSMWSHIHRPSHFSKSSLNAQAVSSFALSQKAMLLTQIIAAVRQFVPVTHIAVLSPLALHARDDASPWRNAITLDPVFAYLLPKLKDLGLNVLPITSGILETPLPDLRGLGAVLMDFHTRPMYYTSPIVAVSVSDQQIVGSKVIASSKIATTVYGKHEVSGIVENDASGSSPSVLHVPISVDLTGITWQQLHIDRARITYRRADGIAFLPVFIQHSYILDERNS